MILCEMCGYSPLNCKCKPGEPYYGVPTGAVPCVEYQPPLRRSVVARAAVLGVDPIQKVVDDYLLMERKARAWDVLYAEHDDPRTRSAMSNALNRTPSPG
jgi:hypothetical protein